MAKHVDISADRLRELQQQFPAAASYLARAAKASATGVRLRRRDLQRGIGDNQAAAMQLPLMDILFGALDSPAATACPKPQPMVAPSHTAPSPGEATARAWRSADGAVVGGAHLRCEPPMPCQDASAADVSTRPMVVVADGAGSAELSHLGAQALVEALRRLLHTLEFEIAPILDQARPSHSAASSLADIVVRHAQGVQADLAAHHRRSMIDFRSTLLLWVIGTRFAFWLKVGDGALVAELGGALVPVGPLGKGEFANQTTFIGPELTAEEWSWGLLSADEASGFAAMSDGAAERLVANDGSRVSAVLGTLFRGLWSGDVGRRELFALLSDDATWRSTSGDDKALALVATSSTPTPSKAADPLTPAADAGDHSLEKDLLREVGRDARQATGARPVEFDCGPNPDVQSTGGTIALG